MREILINAGQEETRVALKEDGHLAEIFFEREVYKTVVGNIYKGRVENVLPGMGAAFVDIGLEKNGFLYGDDLLRTEEQNGLPIERVLKKGHEILVQIIKEAIGTKGARITGQITLPGKYLVLMPEVDYIGISRRIEDEEERSRLKQLIEEVKPEGMGVILRTAANGQNLEELRRDLHFLLQLWEQIQRKSRVSKAARLVYQDVDIIYRVIRDYFNEETYRIVVDSRAKYEELYDFIKVYEPRLLDKLVYREEQDLFRASGVEHELSKALRRKIWLKSGSYLIFDETEALTVIDVNTGKFVGRDSLAETILKTNLEAAKEILRQIRLKSIGGIIIIDFIDMESLADQEIVLNFLKEEAKKDRVKTIVLGLTKLGLVEMTRKKERPSLTSLLQKPCPYCEGRGKILGEETLVINAQREIERLAQNVQAEAILIGLNPIIAGFLIGPCGSYLKRLEERIAKNIYIKGISNAELDEVKIITWGSKKEVEALSLPVKKGQILLVEIEEVHMAYPRNGLARLNGYVLEIEKGAVLLGEKVNVEITEVYRTFAKAKIASLN